MRYPRCDVDSDRFDGKSDNHDFKSDSLENERFRKLYSFLILNGVYRTIPDQPSRYLCSIG